MENETVPEIGTVNLPQQLTVVVLSAIAGFLAAEATKKGVNAAIAAFRNR